MGINEAIKAKKINKSSEILENQLHEQYAINENSRNNVLVSFIVGIVALFFGYGYVFAHTGNNRGSTNYNFSPLDFSFISTATVGVLFFLAVLSLYLGYSLRRDQIIICRIRRKRFQKQEYKDIFGEQYKPCGKEKKDFIHSFYNIFYWLFFGSEIFIFIASIKKYYSIYICKANCLEKYICRLTLTTLLIHIIFILLTLSFRDCYFNKYSELINLKIIKSKNIITDNNSA